MQPLWIPIFNADIKGWEMIVNAFQNYLKKHPDSLKCVQDSTSAQSLVLRFLEESGIKYYYHPEDTVEDPAKKFDDLLLYCKDLCSRTIHSLVIDKLEEENDALGLRAIRTTMIRQAIKIKTVKPSKVHVLPLAIAGKTSILKL